MRDNSLRNESIRIRKEYERRETAVERDFYAPWQPGEILMTAERKRIAALLLKQHGKFPGTGDQALEIGFGKLGWLADLISWGIKETDLYGIELNPARTALARASMPSAELIVGDAAEMPWEDKKFDYVVVSGVFSSILDHEVRMELAKETERVLSPGGVAIVYDLAVNNPRNDHVNCVKRTELISMFPTLTAREIRSVTLAPPIAHAIAKRSWVLAEVLSALPILRTHLLAILEKPLDS